MLLPLLFAIIVTTSTPLPNNKEQEDPISDAPVETLLDSKSKGDPSIDYSAESTADDKKNLYCPKKLGSSSDSSILQHSAPTFPSTMPLLQSAPPTKKPIERKTVKALSGYALGITAFYYGIQVGTSLGGCLGLDTVSLVGLSILSIGLGIIAAAITIHYTWQFINYLF
ncbi:MAG: hypothetical protein WCO92_02990 [Verrucomicrobiota bacterium]